MQNPAYIEAFMSKILALDLGDQWVGTALSDALGMFAKPYKTIAASQLESFLKEIVESQNIAIVVIGYPKTMSGGESAQTKKIITQKETLAALWPHLTFVLWDERLSSKRAQTLGSRKTKEEKLKSHSIAAAFILDSYLNFKSSNG